MRGLRDARCVALFVFVFVNPIPTSLLSHLCHPALPWPCLGTRTSLAKFVHDYDENVIVRLQFDCASLGQRVCDGLMSVQVRDTRAYIHTKIWGFSFHFSKNENESKIFVFYSPFPSCTALFFDCSRMTSLFLAHTHTYTSRGCCGGWTRPSCAIRTCSAWSTRSTNRIRYTIVHVAVWQMSSDIASIQTIAGQPVVVANHCISMSNKLRVQRRPRFHCNFSQKNKVEQSVAQRSLTYRLIG